jgi:hypothetical protein
MFLDKWGVFLPFPDAVFSQFVSKGRKPLLRGLCVGSLTTYLLAHRSEGGSAVMAISHFAIAIFVGSVFMISIY